MAKSRLYKLVTFQAFVGSQEFTSLVRGKLSQIILNVWYARSEAFFLSVVTEVVKGTFGSFE